MNAAEQKWLHDLIVSEADRTRAQFTVDLSRVEQKSEESHHRLRQEIQRLIGQQGKLVGQMDGFDRRLTLVENGKPRRENDDPDTDYRPQRNPVVVVEEDTGKQMPFPGDHRVSDRDLKIFLGTVAAMVSLLKLLPAIITWAMSVGK